MSQERCEIPIVIGGERIRSGLLDTVVMPHAHGHVLADWHRATPELVDKAIAAATAAQREWASWPWEDRAAVFLKAAELLPTTWRSTINAATMLGQSKTAHQAEIDSACELIDFLRFNAAFAEEIYGEQLVNDRGVWNRLDWRPLEGFVYAITPFNFTAIGGNLSTAPALMGNTVAVEAGGVGAALGLVHLPPARGGRAAAGRDQLRARQPARDLAASRSAHRDLAGIHFTGSTGVFDSMWKTVAEHVVGLPRLSAHRRRDRRQGLHRRPPVGRSRGARGRHRPRRLRVPGPEVLGGEPRLHPAIAVARGPRSHSSA